MKAWLLLACCCGISWAVSWADEARQPVVREGLYWVQTVTGNIQLAQSGRLRVVTEGNVELRGQAAGTASTYRLKKRVRAASAAEAERAMRDFTVRLTSQGGAVTLRVSSPKRTSHGADLWINAPRGLRLAAVDTLGGNVGAFDFDGEVHAGTAAGRIELDRLGSNAQAKTGGGEIHAGRVAGGLRCFSGGGDIRAANAGRESFFETAGGNIVIGEVGGSVHASSGGGNISVVRSAGEVFAHTAAGVIEVQRAAGLVTADTAGGSIQIDTANGVRCESTAGAIRLRNVNGGALRATTAAGSILAELMAGAHIGDSMLSATAGDVTVFISSNTPVTVQARNEAPGGMRSIVSEFPEIRIRSAVDVSQPVLADGMLNGGGPILRIFATGGTIYLRRQK